MRIPVVTGVRESIRYGFAVGKVRVLETRIFGHATYERLLDAADFEEQRRILSDTVYGRYLEGTTTADGVERGLSQALDAFYGFLDEAELPPVVTRFFRVRYDFTNLKAALKARGLGVPLEGMLEDLGTIDAEAFSGPLDELPEPFGSLAAELLAQDDADDAGAAAASGTIDTAAIDTAVDRAMFAELVELGRRSGSSFLKGLAALMVDIANGKTVLRARMAEMPVAQVETMLIDGGSLAVKRLLKAYTQPVTELIETLASSPSLKAVGIAGAADLERLDVIADNIVVNYLRSARAVPIGPEPVIAYVLAREAEIVALRTVLLGTLSKIDPEKVRTRLRDLYV